MTETVEMNESGTSLKPTTEITQDDLRRRLASLQQLSSVISSTLDLDEVMKSILDTIHTLLGFEYATVSLVDHERQVVEGKYASHKGKFGAFWS